MALVEKSVLVNYSAERMFGLVEGVERYPEFLPWCGASEVQSRDAGVTQASVLIDYHGVKQTFKTKNRTLPYELIEIQLVSGPFRELDGAWHFIALSPDACKIEFRLHYEFSSRLLEKLVGPVFKHIAGTLVDAFLRRAQQQYGT
ncbi:MAG: type II toxin-antitoxin system RatA family toxin [Betaproteobacteria bacterium]